MAAEARIGGTAATGASSTTTGAGDSSSTTAAAPASGGPAAVPAAGALTAADFGSASSCAVAPEQTDQISDADGIAEILTIYPGWYEGRTVHIHAKVHLSDAEALTTQLYFDDGLTDAVYRSAPYSARPDRTTRNDDDGSFRPETALSISEDGEGYLGLLTLAVRRP